MTAIIEIIILIWGIGFVLLAIWLLLVEWNKMQMNKYDRSQKAKIDAARERRQKIDEDASFDRVMAMLGTP